MQEVAAAVLMVVVVAIVNVFPFGESQKPENGPVALSIDRRRHSSLVVLALT